MNELRELCSYRVVMASSLGEIFSDPWSHGALSIIRNSHHFPKKWSQKTQKIWILLYTELEFVAILLISFLSIIVEFGMQHNLLVQRLSSDEELSIVQG